MTDISYGVGIPESLRRSAAELYDTAFREKIGVAIRDREARLDVVAAGLDLSKACGAFGEAALLGLAGFHDSGGSLTGGITIRRLRRRLGIFRTVRAVAVFALLDRTPAPGELLMDGIVVGASHRGRGIGTGLFRLLEGHARSEGFETIRLDVVDTNPDARRLYERLGFVAGKTDRVPFLGPLMGFGASTTMIKTIGDTGSARADAGERPPA